MDIEELVVIYKNEKSWISTRLSTIDSLLDRAAYGNVDEVEELTKESDELEKRAEELKQIGVLIGKVNELNRLINVIEDNIDILACFTGNETKIENLYKEIDGLEDNKFNILKDIELRLNIDKFKPDIKSKR